MPSRPHLLQKAMYLSKSLIFLSTLLSSLTLATFTLDTYRNNMDAYGSSSGGGYPYDPHRGTYGGIPYGQQQLPQGIPYRSGYNPSDPYDTNWNSQLPFRDTRSQERYGSYSGYWNHGEGSLSQNLTILKIWSSLLPVLVQLVLKNLP